MSASSSTATLERHVRLAGLAPQVLREKLRTVRLTGERKPVTALFADVVGSTSLAESMDPEDWAAVINQAFEVMSEAIFRYEGTIAQLIGDGILAFFGAPLAHEDDPERAVRAALDMLAALRATSEALRPFLGADLGIRIGISTGPVVVGNVGSDLRYEYTALGDAVNVAARMQAAAEPGSILVTEDTYRFVAPLVSSRDLGEVDVRGKAEPVHVHEILGLGGKGRPVRGVPGLHSPMVGRADQLAQLQAALAAVRGGRGRVAVLLGDPGIGKSRLLAEFRRATVAGGLAGWAEGHCLSYGRTLPYHLLLDLVRYLLAVPTDEGRALTALEARVRGLLEDDWRDAALYLAHLLALPVDQAEAARLAALDPSALQEHYLGSLRRVIAALAGEGPLVLACEDLHWADASSVEALTKLLPVVDEVPVLLVLTGRPDREAPGWDLVSETRRHFGEALAELALTPLPEGASRELIGHLLAIESLPEPTRVLLLTKTEGNPFFVEEVVRMLIDRGALERRGDTWYATEQVTSLEIPDTVHGLLLARIDRLPPSAKRTLKVASLVGRSVSRRGRGGGPALYGRAGGRPGGAHPAGVLRPDPPARGGAGARVHLPARVGPRRRLRVGAQAGTSGAAPDRGRGAGTPLSAAPGRARSGPRPPLRAGGRHPTRGRPPHHRRPPRPAPLRQPRGLHLLRAGRGPAAPWGGRGRSRRPPATNGSRARAGRGRAVVRQLRRGTAPARRGPAGRGGARRPAAARPSPSADRPESPPGGREVLHERAAAAIVGTCARDRRGARRPLAHRTPQSCVGREQALRRRIPRGDPAARGGHPPPRGTRGCDQCCLVHGNARERVRADRAVRGSREVDAPAVGARGAQRGPQPAARRRPVARTTCGAAGRPRRRGRLHAAQRGRSRGSGQPRLRVRRQLPSGQPASADECARKGRVGPAALQRARPVLGRRGHGEPEQRPAVGGPGAPGRGRRHATTRGRPRDGAGDGRPAGRRRDPDAPCRCVGVPVGARLGRGLARSGGERARLRAARSPALTPRARWRSTPACCGGPDGSTRALRCRLGPDRCSRRWGWHPSTTAPRLPAKTHPDKGYLRHSPSLLVRCPPAPASSSVIRFRYFATICQSMSAVLPRVGSSRSDSFFPSSQRLRR